MEPALASIYESLLRLEELAGVRLSIREAAQEGIDNGSKFYSADLADFNRLASELSARPMGLDETIQALGKIRLLSLALEDEFRGISDSIERAAREVSRHGA